MCVEHAVSPNDIPPSTSPSRMSGRNDQYNILHFTTHVLFTHFQDCLLILESLLHLSNLLVLVMVVVEYLAHGFKWAGAGFVNYPFASLCCCVQILFLLLVHSSTESFSTTLAALSKSPVVKGAVALERT